MAPGPWKGWAKGSGGQREGRGRDAVRSAVPGTPLHPGAPAAARVCQPPRGARPGARWPLHLPDRPLFGGQEKTTVPPLTAAHLLDEGRAPAPLTSSKSAFPPPGPAGPQTEMDGSGCWWKKAPWLHGQGQRGFQEGRGPRFWLLLGWQEEEEEKRASGGWWARPHLSHPKELLEFPPLCATSRRVLGATDPLPCVRLGHPALLGLAL